MSYRVRKTFHILPIFSISRISNSLSKRAREDFNSKWDHYYEFHLGWFLWNWIIEIS